MVIRLALERLGRIYTLGSPAMIVYIIGLILAIIRYRRHPVPSLCMVIFFISNLIFIPILYASLFLPRVV